MTYELKLPEGYVKPKLLRRDRWTAALRSGEFKQGETFLREHGFYCCLGVLEEIEEGPFTHQCGLSESIPQHKIIGRYGKFPAGVFYGDVYSAAALNDDLRLTFLQIADLIESVWENDDGSGDA